MRLVVLSKFVSGLALLSGILFVGCFTSCATAEDAASAEKQSEKQDDAKQPVVKKAVPTKKKAKKFSGRLPVYFGEVVSGQQRDKIYAIQSGYAERMAELVAQVKALQAQQMSDVEAVLTVEQKKKVDELRAAALAKRKARAAAAKVNSQTSAK